MNDIDNFTLINNPQTNYFTNLIVKKRKPTFITPKGVFST